MSDFISVPEFPNVPFAAGVPPVLRGPGNIDLPTPTLQSADAPGLTNGQPPPKWGLYDASGEPVIVSDSTVRLEFASDHDISNYPVEQGKFQSYNKVTIPYDAKVTMVKTGTDDDRAQFLTQLQNALDSLDLYSVVTPEITYANANVKHYDYSRAADRGAYMITAEVWVQQVRTSATTQFTDTTDPAQNQPGDTHTASGVSPVNGGAVQTVDPTPAQESIISRTIAEDPPGLQDNPRHGFPLDLPGLN